MPIRPENRERYPIDFDVSKMVDEVLTIGHLDHLPENCDQTNLRAWCQRCHLRYDAKHHAETARITRRSKLAIAELLEATNSGHQDLVVSTHKNKRADHTAKPSEPDFPVQSAQRPSSRRI